MWCGFPPTLPDSPGLKPIVLPGLNAFDGAPCLRFFVLSMVTLTAAGFLLLVFVGMAGPFPLMRNRFYRVAIHSRMSML